METGKVHIGGNMWVPVESKCEQCGAGVQSLRFYKGWLGFEAIECKECGHQEDLNKEVNKYETHL